MLTPQLEEVARIWPSIDSVVSVPHTEEAYNRLVDFVHELVEEVGEDENHSLASLLDTLGTLIEAYETEHLPEPKGSPLETLMFLMDEHGLDRVICRRSVVPKSCLRFLQRSAFSMSITFEP